MIVFDREFIAPWVAERCSCPLIMDGMTAVGLVQGNKLVAGVMYTHYTGKSVEAAIAVDPEAVLTKQFMWVIFDYPFTQLAVEKIMVYVSSANKKSIAMMKRLGFIIEATIPDVYLDGDMLIATLIKSNCKWLENKHGQESQSA